MKENPEKSKGIFSNFPLSLNFRKQDITNFSSSLPSLIWGHELMPIGLFITLCVKHCITTLNLMFYMIRYKDIRFGNTYFCTLLWQYAILFDISVLWWFRQTLVVAREIQDLNNMLVAADVSYYCILKKLFFCVHYRE